MKIIFLSDKLQAGILPFCEEMKNALGENFCFWTLEALTEEQKHTKYGKAFASLSYVGAFSEDREKKEQELLLADAVICRNVPYSYIEKRIQKGGVTLRYSDRLVREKSWKFVNPRTKMQLKREHVVAENLPVYLLCTGAYMAEDYARIGAYKGKLLKWGDYPKAEVSAFADLLKKKEKHSLLWAGKMQAYRKPEEAVYAVLLMKEELEDIHLTMIGEGEKYALVESLIKEQGLENNITLLPMVKAKELQEYMQKSEIFLLTSDRQEVWGTSVLEAMQNGCAVVSSHQAGVTPYLIPEDGLAGFVYSSKDIGDLANAAFELLLDDAKRINMAERGHESVCAYWNVKESVVRLLDFCEGLLVGEERIYSGGPLSPASVLKRSKTFKGEWEEQN